MKNIFVVFTFFLLLSYQLYAQENAHPATPLFETIIIDTTDVPPTYNINYFGFGAVQLRDRYLSQLRFAGIAMNNNWNRLTYRTNRASLFRTMFNLGFASNGANDSEVGSFKVEMAYAEMFRLTDAQEQRTRFFLGPELMLDQLVNFHLGNQNNVVGYNLALPLGINTLFEHQFSLFNREFMFSNNFSVPVVTLLTRNPYTFPYPELSEGGYSFSEILQFGTWDRYLNLQNRMSIDYYRNVKRKRKLIAKTPMRVSYLWNFQHMGQPNQLLMGSHFISFTTFFRERI